MKNVLILFAKPLLFCDLRERFAQKKSASIFRFWQNFYSDSVAGMTSKWLNPPSNELNLPTQNSSQIQISISLVEIEWIISKSTLSVILVSKWFKKNALQRNSFLHVLWMSFVRNFPIFVCWVLKGKSWQVKDCFHLHFKQTCGQCGCETWAGIWFNEMIKGIIFDCFDVFTWYFGCLEAPWIL